jgi:hypothetical protein
MFILLTFLGGRRYLLNAGGGTHDQKLGALLPRVRPIWVQSSDRRLDDDLLGTVGARIVSHVAVWQRSTRSSLAASILAADRDR